MSSESRSPAVQTLRRTDDRLELIDQRVLPSQFQYVNCSNAAEVAQAIRDMVVRGAPANGDVANKIGTYMHAVLAARHAARGHCRYCIGLRRPLFTDRL